MGITLTSMQEKAVKMSIEWFNSSDKHKKPFVLSGYAGTGKSTVIKSIVEGLNLREDEITFSAFTGMAASVLTKKGNPASTIHKLIYDPKVYKNKVIFELKDRINSSIKLIIADEFSTIGDDLMTDLESFNIPIILVGDKGQLPPVLAKPNKYIDYHDILLTDVMRQALDNPIIWLATKARLGEELPYGNHGNEVMVIRSNEINNDHLVWADQIISNTNHSVDYFNNRVRKNIFNLESEFPYIGEKIICLRNNWDRNITIENNITQYLVNGLIGTVEDIGKYNTNINAFKIAFKPNFTDTNEIFTNVYADGIYFLEGIKKEEELRINENIKDKYKRCMILRKAYEDNGHKIDKFSYGYAITTYKSQGSEFDNVLFYHDYTAKKLMNSSAYVGITRAKENLILVR